MAGMIIFPACFSFGVEANQGPSLIFQTLPNVFVNMAGGRVWGALFFLFMIFASFSTVLAVFENIHGHLHGHLRLEPEKGRALVGVARSRSGQPALRAGLQSLDRHVHVIGAPRYSGQRGLHRLATCCCRSVRWSTCCSASRKWGWGFDKYLAEANEGQGPQVLPEAQGLLPVDPPHSDPHHSHSRSYSNRYSPNARGFAVGVFCVRNVNKKAASP